MHAWIDDGGCEADLPSLVVPPPRYALSSSSSSDLHSFELSSPSPPSSSSSSPFSVVFILSSCCYSLYTSLRGCLVNALLAPCHVYNFSRRIRLHVGSRFTLMMLSTYVGLKGLLFALITDSMLPYMRELGYDGLVYQRIVTVAFVPWGMKGLLGSLSDAFPLGGYHKKFYMLISSLTGAVSLLSLLLLSSQTSPAHRLSSHSGVQTPSTSTSTGTPSQLSSQGGEGGGGGDGRTSSILSMKEEEESSQGSSSLSLVSPSGHEEQDSQADLTSGGAMSFFFFPATKQEPMIFLSPDTHIMVLGLIYFCIQLQIATVDLMCEGMYSRVMIERPRIGSDLVTFVNACTAIGAVLGRLIVGPVSDSYGTYPLFLLALPVALQSLIPIICNFLQEEKVNPPCGMLKDKVSSQRSLFVMAVSVALCASGVAILTLLSQKGGAGGDQEGGVKSLLSLGSSSGQENESSLQGYILPYCICVSIILVLLCFVCLPSQLAKCNVFFFADRLLHISISGALDFFYTASPDCVPNGPHFDYTYYSTFTAIAGTIATWMGLFLFQSYLCERTYRELFFLTSGVRIVASLFDYIIVKRVNIDILGIPDKAMYLLGDAIILSLINSLSHMPGVILTSRLCPRQMESTVYAILAGISNFGHTISTLLGLRIIKLSNIRTTASEGSQCDFKNLPFLILCVHCFLPMLSIPLAMVLLPNKRMNEALLPDEDRDRQQQHQHRSTSTSHHQLRDDSEEDGNRERERDKRRRRRRGGDGESEMLKRRRWSYGEEGQKERRRGARVKRGEEEGGIEMRRGKMSLGVMDSDNNKKRKEKEDPTARMRSRKGRTYLSQLQSNPAWKRVHDDEEGEEEEEEESQYDDEVYIHRNKRSSHDRNHHRAIDMDSSDVEDYLFTSSEHHRLHHRQHIDEGKVYKSIESSSSPTNQGHCMVYKQPPHRQRGQKEEEEERREEKKEEEEEDDDDRHIPATPHRKDSIAVMMIGMSPDDPKEEKKKMRKKKKKREFQRSQKGEKTSDVVERVSSRLPSFYSLSSSSSLSYHAPQRSSSTNSRRSSTTYEVLETIEGGQEDEKDTHQRRARRFQRDTPLLMHALSSPRGERKQGQIGERRTVEGKEQSTTRREEERRRTQESSRRRRLRRRERDNKGEEEEDREEMLSSSSSSFASPSSSHLERGSSSSSISSSEKVEDEDQGFFAHDDGVEPPLSCPSEERRHETRRHRHPRLIVLSPSQERDRKVMSNNSLSLHPSSDPGKDRQSSSSSASVFPSSSLVSFSSQGGGHDHHPHLLSRSSQQRSLASTGRHQVQCPDGEAVEGLRGTSCRGGSSRHQLTTSRGGHPSQSYSFPEEIERCKTEGKEEEQTRMSVEKKKKKKKREAERRTEEEEEGNVSSSSSPSLEADGSLYSYDERSTIEPQTFGFSASLRQNSSSSPLSSSSLSSFVPSSLATETRYVQQTSSKHQPVLPSRFTSSSSSFPCDREEKEQPHQAGGREHTKNLSDLFLASQSTLAAPGQGQAIWCSPASSERHESSHPRYHNVGADNESTCYEKSRSGGTNPTRAALTIGLDLSLKHDSVGKGGEEEDLGEVSSSSSTRASMLIRSVQGDTPTPSYSTTPPTESTLSSRFSAASSDRDAPPQSRSSPFSSGWS